MDQDSLDDLIYSNFPLKKHSSWLSFKFKDPLKEQDFVNHSLSKTNLKHISSGLLQIVCSVVLILLFLCIPVLKSEEFEACFPFLLSVMGVETLVFAIASKVKLKRKLSVVRYVQITINLIKTVVLLLLAVKNGNQKEMIGIVTSTLVMLNFQGQALLGFNMVKSVLTIGIQTSLILLLFGLNSSSLINLTVLIFVSSLLKGLLALVEYCSREAFCSLDSSKRILQSFSGIIEKSDSGVFIFSNKDLIFHNKRAKELQEDHLSDSLPLSTCPSDSITKIRNTYTQLDNCSQEIELNSDETVEKINIPAQNLFEKSTSVFSSATILFLGRFEVNSKTDKETKILEIHISSLSTGLACLLVNDVSPQVQLKAVKESERRINKMMSKLTHEFISPLQNCCQLIQDSSPHLYKSVWTDQSVSQLRANFRKTKDLIEFILCLTEDVTAILKEGPITPMMPAAEVDVLELNCECIQIAKTILEMNDFKSSTVSFENYANRLNSKAFSRLNQAEFKKFLLNIYTSAAKHARAGKIVVSFEMEENQTDSIFSIRSMRKSAIFNVRFDSDFDYINLEEARLSDDYSKYQATDISLDILKSISENAGLEFKVVQQDSKVLFAFKVPIVKEEVGFEEDSENSTDQTVFDDTGFYIDKQVVLNPSILKDNNLKVKMKKSVSFSPDIKPSNRMTKKSITEFMTKTVRKGISNDNLSLNNTNLKVKYCFDDFSKFSDSKHITQKGFKSGMASVILGERKAVLVVDDMSHMRKLAVNQLKAVLEEEFEFLELRDGVELLAKVLEIQHSNEYSGIHCIVSDEFMNYMNGSKAFEILEEWELDRKIAPIPKISCTAFFDSSNLPCMQEGLVDFVLNKPLRKTELRDALEKLKLIR